MLRLLLVALALACASPAFSQAAPAPAGTTAPTPAPQPASPLADAEDKLDSGDRPAARALLNTYLSAHPDDPRALFDRGYLEDADDHPDAAEGFYRKAIALAPQQFESRLALGLLLAARGPAAAAEARLHLEAATHLAPQPPNPAAQAQAYRALARLLRTTDPEAARQSLLSALKLAPATPSDTLLTGEIAEAAGDPETAEQAYRGILASAAVNPDVARQATSALAHLLIAGKQYPQAELLLRQALTHNAGDPVLTAQLANVLMAQDKSADALTLLETLHTSQPADRSIAAMLADLYTQSGQPAKADPLFAQLLSPGAPGPGETLLASRGDNLVRQQRFAEAIPILQQAVHLNPQDGNAWSSLAFAASVTHQPQLTLDALAMRSKVMAETPATYFLAATACDTLHQTKRAVESYKQFLAVAGGKFPDEEWQAKHRLVALSR
ncbi:MAG TPA: tetratricopeptide repeat protein [Acidobacteriaceae bacterium]